MEQMETFTGKFLEIMVLDRLNLWQKMMEAMYGMQGTVCV